MVQDSIMYFCMNYNNDIIRIPTFLYMQDNFNISLKIGYL